MLTVGQRLAGVLIGGAVGDALGLPTEGLSPQRQWKWWPGELCHRFVFGRGMVSDDTEHAFMTAQAVLAAHGDLERFRRSLAWQLRWWFLALPAGVGFATARACLRLWLGVPADRSGVNSAGNGPSMRSAILGAVFATDANRRRDFVRASTRLTHLDPRAETAAQAVAEAAAFCCRTRVEQASSEDRRTELIPDDRNIADVIQSMATLTDDPEWRRLCARMSAALDKGDSVQQFSNGLNLHRGITGYAYHTVPVALYAWLRYRGKFEDALGNTIRCGGDTDTVAAICGALVGCDVGPEGIPKQWRNGICDWPRTRKSFVRLAQELAAPTGKPIRWFWPGVLPRNIIFLSVVLIHGLRRLFPPFG